MTGDFQTLAVTASTGGVTIQMLPPDYRTLARRWIGVAGPGAGPRWYRDTVRDRELPVSTRYVSLRYLAGDPHPESTAILAQLAAQDGEDARLRWGALFALCGAGGPRSLEALAGAFGRRTPHRVRSDSRELPLYLWAFDFLLSIPEAGPRLASIARDEDAPPPSAAQAALALARADPDPWIARLREVAESRGRNAIRRHWALLALDELVHNPVLRGVAPDPAAIAQRIAALREDPAEDPAVRDMLRWLATPSGKTLRIVDPDAGPNPDPGNGGEQLQ